MIAINSHELAAASTCSSPHRTLFCSVLLEARRGKNTLAVSVDGRALIAVRSEVVHDSEDQSMLLGWGFVSTVLKLAAQVQKKKEDKRILFHLPVDPVNPDTATASFPGEVSALTLTDDAIVQGKFPNWREILPRPGTVPEPPSLKLSFDNELLKKFSLAAKLLGSGSWNALVVTQVSGCNGPLLVQSPGAPFIGIQMPMRYAEVQGGVPEWAL